MNSEWSLKELYSGYDDPEFLADIGRLEECVAEYIKMAGELNRAQATSMSPRRSAPMTGT